MIRYGALLVACILCSTGLCHAFGTMGRISHRPMLVAPSFPSRPSMERAKRHPRADIRTTNLWASKNGKAGSKIKEKIPESVTSAALLIALDIFFRKAFQTFQIAFPSSLGGCGILLAILLARAKPLYKAIAPGAALFAKWLPVFFVPSLITLPLTGSMGDAVELTKVFLIVSLGFVFTLLSTAYSVVFIRNMGLSKSEQEATDAIQEATQDATQVVADSVQAVVDKVEEKGKMPKTFSDDLMQQLQIGLAGAAVVLVGGNWILPTAWTRQLTQLVFLLTTLHNFVWGARLPRKFTKIVHPLVTCTGLTWATMTVLGKAVLGKSFKSLLRSYKKGAGSFLLFLLGPAVVSLAVSMYDRRKLIQQNSKEVGTAIGVASVGGLFGTAAVVRSLSNPSLRLALLSRNITSPLAMAMASVLGANVGWAVAIVVVTGLLGANFGASLLSAAGIHDPVARGLGMGAAAHGLGTAALAEGEPAAFSFSAIAMALTASACTVLVSIPRVQRTLIQLALGG